MPGSLHLGSNLSLVTHEVALRGLNGLEKRVMINLDHRDDDDSRVLVDPRAHEDAGPLEGRRGVDRPGLYRQVERGPFGVLKMKFFILTLM